MGAKIRNRYNQVPHLTQDTNGKVTNSQLDTTNGSQEASPLPAGDLKTHINRGAFVTSITPEACHNPHQQTYQTQQPYDNNAYQWGANFLLKGVDVIRVLSSSNHNIVSSRVTCFFHFGPHVNWEPAINVVQKNLIRKPLANSMNESAY